VNKSSYILVKFLSEHVQPGSCIFYKHKINHKKAIPLYCNLTDIG